jgi:hypothetical protein
MMHCQRGRTNLFQCGFNFQFPVLRFDRFSFLLKLCDSLFQQNRRCFFYFLCAVKLEISNVPLFVGIGNGFQQRFSILPG